MPCKVQKLAMEILRDPIRVTVGEVGVANKDITQVVQVITSDAEKLPWLLEKLPGMIDDDDDGRFRSSLKASHESILHQLKESLFCINLKKLNFKEIKAYLHYKPELHDLYLKKRVGFKRHFLIICIIALLFFLVWALTPIMYKSLKGDCPEAIEYYEKVERAPEIIDEETVADEEVEVGDHKGPDSENQEPIVVPHSFEAFPDYEEETQTEVYDDNKLGLKHSRVGCRLQSLLLLPWLLEKLPGMIDDDDGRFRSSLKASHESILHQLKEVELQRDKA